LYVLSNEIETYTKEKAEETDEKTKQGLDEKIAEIQTKYDELYKKMVEDK
jgi:hypothetical protein